jgi:hypothetical protein
VRGSGEGASEGGGEAGGCRGPPRVTALTLGWDALPPFVHRMRRAGAAAWWQQAANNVGLLTLPPAARAALRQRRADALVEFNAAGLSLYLGGAVAAPASAPTESGGHARGDAAPASAPTESGGHARGDAAAAAVGGGEAEQGGAAARSSSSSHGGAAAMGAAAAAAAAAGGAAAEGALGAPPPPPPPAAAAAGTTSTDPASSLSHAVASALAAGGSAANASYQRTVAFTPASPVEAMILRGLQLAPMALGLAPSPTLASHPWCRFLAAEAAALPAAPAFRLVAVGAAPDAPPLAPACAEARALAQLGPGYERAVVSLPLQCPAAVAGELRRLVAEG